MSAFADPTEGAAPPDPIPGRMETRHESAAVALAAREPLMAQWLWITCCMLGAAVCAGLIAWKIGEATYDLYGPSKEARRSRYDFSALNREQGVADQKNAAIAFGTFAALLGLSLGGASGALRRSALAAVCGGVAGLAIGGLAAALAGYVLAPVWTRNYSPQNPSLLLPVLLRGGTWVAAGIGAGLAFGIGWKGFSAVPRAILGGIVGTVIGTTAFEVINAGLFPFDLNDKLIPTGPVSRLLAYVCVALFAALGAILLGHHGAKRQASVLSA
jgi:hypothetical protein